jgi:hypothetical protein
VVHRADGGRTSLKDYCYGHHHVVLHELCWTLTVHPDGTSQVQSPDGKIIRSHSSHPASGARVLSRLMMLLWTEDASPLSISSVRHC